MKKLLSFLFSMLLFSGCYSGGSFEWLLGKTKESRCEKFLESLSIKESEGVEKVCLSINRLKKEQKLDSKIVKYSPPDKAKFLDTIKNFIKACKKNRPDRLWVEEVSGLHKGLFVRKLIVPQIAKIEFFTDLHADSEPLQDWLAKGQEEGWIDKKDCFKLISKKGEERFYVFLGDYIDRGNEGTINLDILMNLYIKNPNHVVILRGNHEFYEIAQRYGFETELGTAYKLNLAQIDDVFNFLSSACFLVWGNKGIFLTHGGFKRDYDFRELLHKKEKDFQLVGDGFSGQNYFAWSDFGTTFFGFNYNRGTGEILTRKEVAEWLKTYSVKGLELMGVIRGHDQSVFYNNKSLQGAVVYINFESYEQQWMPGSMAPLYLKDLRAPFVLTLDFFRYKPYPGKSWPKGKAPILTLELDPIFDKCRFTRKFLVQKKK